MFKVGDKVRRKAVYRMVNEWCRLAPVVDAVYTVSEIRRVGSIGLTGVSGGWDIDKFDLVEDEPVVEKQVPGVPDGYRLVRIGAPKTGDKFVGVDGRVITATNGYAVTGYAIVEPITPPKPKTVTVVINKYLVGDLAGDPQKLRVQYATQSHMESMPVAYRLLGVSETLEVEMDV